MAGDFFNCEVRKVVSIHNGYKKTDTISFKVDEDTYRTVMQICNDNGISMASLCRQAIEIYIKYWKFRFHLVAYFREVCAFLSDKPIDITRR